VSLELGGCDISGTALGEAESKTSAAGCAAQFFQLDVVRDEFPKTWDVVYCSLFLHHFGHEDAVRLLEGMMSTAERMILIDDLLRSHFGYLLSLVGTKLLSRSRIVHIDGPLSVRAAFNCEEVRALTREAGMAPMRITTGWPARFLARKDIR
jgi:2-polyprenyl-3-methyl-5-hydroxy-6-metoxy-1,4-benzoquinol methylase